MTRRFRIGFFGAVLLALAPVSSLGQTLVADLSSHIIGITTGFAGANLVLFGSTDRPGDIVVIVHGPPVGLTVRKKEKVAGVWLNGSSATFRDVPSFYALAATKPLADIAAPDILARYNIGLDNIKLTTAEPLSDDALAAFRQALLDNQTSSGLYRRDPSKVAFAGERLFRADMGFPANVPTGNYTVETILFAGGQVVSAQTTPLVVSRIGFSNGVFSVAHRHATLYGFGALAFAVAAGWAAGAIFRKV